MSCTDLLRTGAAGNVTNKQNWDTGKEQLCIICWLNKDAIDQTVEIKVYSVSNPQQVELLWAKSVIRKKGTRPANEM